MRIHLTLLFVLVAWLPIHAAPLNQSDVQVYFSPRGGCTDAVVNALNKAKKTILVQAYSFTSPPIAAVLDRAI